MQRLLETPAVISLLGIKKEPLVDEDGQVLPDYYDHRMPKENIFPADFQYLDNHNRRLIKDEVISYIDANILSKEEREEVMAKYDTFRIEAACRRTLKELLQGF